MTIEAVEFTMLRILSNRSIRLKNYSFRVLGNSLSDYQLGFSDNTLMIPSIDSFDSDGKIGRQSTCFAAFTLTGKFSSRAEGNSRYMEKSEIRG